jgi:hypothetical protein
MIYVFHLPLHVKSHLTFPNEGIRTSRRTNASEDRQTVTFIVKGICCYEKCTFDDPLALANDISHNAVYAFNQRSNNQPCPSLNYCLVEEADDLAGDVLATSLLVVHDTGGGGQDNVTELTGGKELDNPLLEVTETDVVAGGDDTGLVEASVELDNDLAGAVVVNLKENGLVLGWLIVPLRF